MPGAVGSCYGAGNGSRQSLFDQNLFPPSAAVSPGRHSSGNIDREKYNLYQRYLCQAMVWMTRGDM